jgi:hypothetical protein
MKKFTFLALILFAFSCDSNDKAISSSSDSTKTDTSTSKKLESKSDSSVTESQDSEKPKWEYSEKEDKMTNKTNYYASIDANELLDFPFPYDGGSTASLNIRKTSTGNEAILQVSKGQFITDVEGTEVKIKFDSEQPTTFNCSSSSDGSTNVLFINSTNKLIKKLKTAKKIIIQAEFYESGSKEMEFDVTGFTWAH